MRLLGAQLDEIGEPLPATEAGLRWLRLNAPPPPERAALVHGDFRLGNFIVSGEGLAAVIDWELCHVGDPAEDLAWMCVRSWRFGNDDRPAAGLGSREELLDSYEAAGGTRPRPRAPALVGGDGKREVGGDLRPPGRRSSDRPPAQRRAGLARAADLRARVGPVGLIADAG